MRVSGSKWYTLRPAQTLQPWKMKMNRVPFINIKKVIYPLVQDFGNPQDIPWCIRICFLIFLEANSSTIWTFGPSVQHWNWSQGLNYHYHKLNVHVTYCLLKEHWFYPLEVGNHKELPTQPFQFWWEVNLRVEVAHICPGSWMMVSQSWKISHKARFQEIQIWNV